MKCKTFIVLVSLFLTKAAHAVPAISSVGGDFNHMSTVTITGTAFSTYGDFAGVSHGIPHHLALGYKDFEDNTIESDKMTVVAGLTSHWAVLTDGSNRTNSAHYGHRFFVTERFAGLRITQSVGLLTGTYYDTFWIQTPDQANNCGAKFERLYYGTHTSVDNTYFTLGDCPGWGVRSFSECGGTCSPPPNQTQFSPSGNAVQNNTWHRIDIYRNLYDGEVTLWKDMKRMYTNRRSCSGLSLCSNEEWMEASQFVPGRSWEIGHEAQSVTGCDLGQPLTLCAADIPKTGEWYFDDIFMSYNRAHIELCEESTWTEVSTGVSHCEIQIPTSWSSTSINIKMNTGAFGSGNTAYLYVVTNNTVTGTDDVNENGFQIEIGQTGEGCTVDCDGEDPGDPGPGDGEDAPVFDGEGVCLCYQP